MNVALVLSGGTGTRIGSDIPKQYIEVGGQPIISYCMKTLLYHDRIDAIQIVADVSWQEQILEWQERSDERKDQAVERQVRSLESREKVSGQKSIIGGSLWREKFRGFSSPGKTRQLSIYHGLEDIKTYADDMDYVFVHDAARPLLSAKLITDCLDGAIGHDGAMPVLPMKDTVYYSRLGKSVDQLLDRSTIFAGQAPEVFLLGKYYEANKRLFPDQILKVNGSTEPAILAGMDIMMIPGEEKNYKITTKADLERFREMID